MQPEDTTNKRKILIADSDHFVRELATKIFQEAGYDVITATDGYQALDAVRKILPFAVLTEIMLPRLDGLTLCRLIKNDAEIKEKILVFVFSVLTAEERAKKSGADGFLLKPFERKRLTGLLQNAVATVQGDKL